MYDYSFLAMAKEREMKHTATQLSAYNAIKENLSGKRAEIYNFLAKFPNGLTRNEIERKSGYKYRINAICGRVNELIALGLIKVVGVKKDALTNKETEILKVVEW